MSGQSTDPSSISEETEAGLLDSMRTLSGDLRKLRRRTRWNRLMTILLAVALVGVGLSLHRADEARSEGRQTICSMFDVFANAIVHQEAPPATDAERQRRQTEVDAIAAEYDAKAAPFGCKLHVVVPGP